MHSKEREGFGYELPGQNFYRTGQARWKALHPILRQGNCTTADIEQALRRHHTDLLDFDANEEGAFLIVGIRRT